MPADTFAIRLLRLQSLHGISAAKLATELKIGRSTVNQLQQGRANPRFDTLIKLAMLFGVSTDYLCGLKDQP